MFVTPWKEVFYINVSGLYTITNKLNNNTYVGITSNTKIRWYNHQKELINGYNNRYSEGFLYNKPRCRHHQLYLQLEFNEMYEIYKDNIWGLYEFDLIFPVSYKFYNKNLEKIEDAYILKLRETNVGYYQMTNIERNNKYKIIEIDGLKKIVNILEENKKQVIDDYLIYKLSYREISNKYGSNTKSVMNFLRKYEIPTRNASSCKMKFDIENFKDEIIDMYIKQSLNAQQIGKIYGTACGTITTHLKKWGIKTRSMEEIFAGIVIDDFKEEITDMYINQNISMYKIGAFYNVSKTTIKKYLTKWNVHIKCKSDYSINKVLQTNN